MVVNKRYLYERYNFGLITHSVPLFLVNGNHDGELGWLLNGTPNALPIWATTARQTYFSNPQANAFYLGDNKKDPFTGERSSWYAWHWGDALFVVLDPFWNSPLQSNKDGWNLTLGSNQYQWLSQTQDHFHSQFSGWSRWSNARRYRGGSLLRMGREELRRIPWF
jgi:hypothetical protein